MKESSSEKSKRARVSSAGLRARVVGRPPYSSSHNDEIVGTSIGKNGEVIEERITQNGEHVFRTILAAGMAKKTGRLNGANKKSAEAKKKSIRRAKNVWHVKVQGGSPGLKKK